MKKGAKKKKAAPRKPARKTAKRASRKPARRVASKKPSKAKSKRKPKPIRDTIILVPLSGPDHVPRLSKSRKDKVRWWNKDVVDHTITFTIWPFLGTQIAIVVPAGKKSRWFTVSPAVVSRKYSYGIAPPFANQGPPDPPEIVVDG